MVKFKDFSRRLSVFQVLFKANLIFKDFSRQSCIFKYFSSLCEPDREQILSLKSCPISKLVIKNVILKIFLLVFTYQLIVAVLL